MTKVAIAQSSGKGPQVQPQWEVVNFLGRNKSESRGIVDLLVIRKNHDEPPGEVLKRGDLFNLVIIQVKGGSARWPTPSDVARLRVVAKTYGARAVLLSEWQQGSRAKFYQLVEDKWVELADPKEVFSPRRVKKLAAKPGGATHAA